MSHRLESWLASATLDLALSERQRIHDEISAHVNDAITYQSAQGLSALDAEARAVQDLGDPQVARAAFQRTCYTVSDERRLEKLLGRSWWAISFVCSEIYFRVQWWFSIPMTFEEKLAMPDQRVIIGIVITLALFPLYYFEPRSKRWLLKRFSRNGVIAVQTFMALIACTVYWSIWRIFDVLVNQSKVSPSAIYDLTVLTLTCLWIAHQAPLTLKTIRRTRA